MTDRSTRRLAPLGRARSLLAAVAALLGIALVGAVPLVASAQQAPAPKAPAALNVSAEIMVLHATQADGGGSIDPAIGKMPQLTKPPFSAYNTYKLLDRKTLTISTGKFAVYTLPNNRVLQVTFIEPTADHRFHMKVAINQPGNATAYLKLLEVTAAPNEIFFVGGQSYEGGSLVLGITMRP